MIDRRTFLKQSCSFCLVAAAAGTSAALLGGCSAIPVIKATAADNKLVVPQISFAPGDKMKLVRTEKLDFDILLVRKPDATYSAVLMRCTHADNILVANADGLTCNFHGSTFTLDGKVTLGPATQNLLRYNTTTTNENIIIHLNEILKS